MKDFLKTVIGAAVGAGLVLLASIGFGGSALGALDRTTIGNPWTFNGTVTLNGAATAATTTVNGLFTISSAVVATTTSATAATLTEADLLAAQYFTVNLNAASDFTYTLPASSTLTTLLANTGETARWCFDNATTTAEMDLKFVTGVGIDLEMATGTSVFEQIGPADSGCLTLQRKANTDLFGRFDSYDDSD